MKVLLLWNMFEDGLVPYLFDRDHPMVATVMASNDVFINITDVEDTHPVFRLNEWLGTKEAEDHRCVFPLTETISSVSHTGFAC